MTTASTSQPKHTCRYKHTQPGLWDRLLSVFVVLITGSVLGASAWLTADPVGMGTHQRLGLPPCGFNLVSGLPCATCGMTTAFTHAAHGRLVQAFVTQPAGALLAIITAMAFLLGIFSLWTNLSLIPVFNWVWRIQTVTVLVVVVLASWAYKTMVIQGWFG